MTQRSTAAHSSILPPPAPLSSLLEWLDLPDAPKNPPSESSSATTTPSTSAISLIQALDPKPFVQDFWKQSTRSDGRLFAQCRPTKVVFGMLKHSAGSALVTQQQHQQQQRSSSTSAATSMTSTKILAATTLQIGQPAPEQPQNGEVIVQVSGTGGKNLGADFARSQSVHWDVLQAWLQRMLSEGDIPSKLNLLTGKACLRLIVSVMILEDGGNVMDAALLACMAAWKDTRLPVVGRDLIESQGKLWWKEGATMSSTTSSGTKSSGTERPSTTNSDNDVSPSDYRVSLTMGIYQAASTTATRLLVDPSSLEERFLDGTLTMVVGVRSGKLQMEYAGKASLSATDLAFAAKMAKARAAELSNILCSDSK